MAQRVPLELEDQTLLDGWSRSVRFSENFTSGHEEVESRFSTQNDRRGGEGGPLHRVEVCRRRRVGASDSCTRSGGVNRKGTKMYKTLYKLLPLNLLIEITTQ